MMTDERPFLQAHEWHPHKKQIKTGNTGTSEPFEYDPVREAFRKERLFCCLKMRLTVRRIIKFFHDVIYNQPLRFCLVYF